MMEPPPEVIERARWEAWRHHLGYILHRDHGWDRNAAASHVERTANNWRPLYLAGKSPEEAAMTFRGLPN